MPNNLESPKKIEKEKMTKKEHLYNDVIECIEKLDVAWNRFEVDEAGKNFVLTLVEALWYIDGHHHVFEKQGCKLPDFVSSFVGYKFVSYLILY